jgi:putative selenium metabolism hydrolase
MLNGHIDTVVVSDPDKWRHDPFGAEVSKGRLYGVGSCDMKAGLAAMVYGAKVLRDSGRPLQGSVAVAGVVQEEPCEGLGTRVLVEEEGIRPDWVVLGEPSNLDVARGQRGRVAIHVTTHGRSAHAASPHLGENAIYGATRLIFGLEMASNQTANDEFLGRGSLAVTKIKSYQASSNAIPDRCELVVDRRLTLGESEALALGEVQRVIAREGVKAEAATAEYHAISYTGYECHAREFFPAWVMPEDHPLVRAMLRAGKAPLRRRPQVGRWDFSTEGVYTAGVAGIPTVGFGPGDPDLAHTADEHVKLSDVAVAAEVYARLGWELIGGR